MCVGVCTCIGVCLSVCMSVWCVAVGGWKFICVDVCVVCSCVCCVCVCVFFLSPPPLCNAYVLQGSHAEGEIDREVKCALSVCHHAVL